jgi:hypothetical protein
MTHTSDRLRARVGFGIRRLEVLGQPASILRGVDDDCFGSTDT